MAKLLALLLDIQVVPGSSLGLGTSYSDEGFSWFYSVPPVYARIVP
jgi:hypothetical protein